MTHHSPRGDGAFLSFANTQRPWCSSPSERNHYENAARRTAQNQGGKKPVSGSENKTQRSGRGALPAGSGAAERGPRDTHSETPGKVVLSPHVPPARHACSQRWHNQLCKGDRLSHTPHTAGLRPGSQPPPCPPPRPSLPARGVLKLHVWSPHPLPPDTQLPSRDRLLSPSVTSA